MCIRDSPQPHGPPLPRRTAVTVASPVQFPTGLDVGVATGVIEAVGTGVGAETGSEPPPHAAQTLMRARSVVDRTVPMADWGVDYSAFRRVRPSRTPPVRTG